MSKTIYIVRHCKAAGQAPDAPLTREGVAQATHLAERLALLPIERIISSPFLRATQSIAPLAQRLGLPIAIDARLAERILSTADLPDWLAALQSTFDDLDRCFEGGESSQTAMQRAVAVVRENEHYSAEVELLVTHGNLMTLLLKHFDQRIGFVEWQRLTNPDVYRVVLARERAEIERVWN
ncbi:MAG: histidine phosphatase family protein [Roseiflexaceae bacterium]